MISKIRFIIVQILVVLLLSITCDYSVKNVGVSKNYLAHTHKILYLDPAFSRIELDIVNAAALEWTTSTHNIITINVKTYTELPVLNSGDDILVFKVPETMHIITVLDNITNNKTLGFYIDNEHINSTILLVSNRLTIENYQSVLMHEIGHALGLSHNPKKWTLMNAAQSISTNHITESDIIEFCKLYKCELH